MLHFDGLLPHQAEHVPWLLERPRAMLAWEMGVGKTAALLRAWENSLKHGPALVLCPATARINWAREIRKMAIDPDFPPRAHIVENIKKFPNADIYILNYEKMLDAGTRQHLIQLHWGVLILDEAHRLKTPDAKTTGHVYGGNGQASLIASAERVWLATGTPCPNHPGELYSPMSALWPQSLQYKGHVMNQGEFEAAFCETVPTVYGPRIVGGRNLGELKARLAPYMSRILRRDVLELPPLMVESWPLDCRAGKHDVPDLMLALRIKYGPVDQIHQLGEDRLDSYLFDIKQRCLRLPTLRRETGMLKAIATAFLIDDELQGGAGKTVVYAHHREVINHLEKALGKYNPAVIHGDVPMKQRQQEIDRFQTSDECSVLIGGLTTAGQSINLQAASNVIFVETSWVPGENEQAISRVYRNGQTESVNVRFVFLPDSIDEAINCAIARKMAMISRVLGG